MSARDALAAAPDGVLEVACGDCGWDSSGGLVLVDRWITDYPPIPYTPIFELYSDRGMDPDDRVRACGDCDAELDDDAVVPR